MKKTLELTEKILLIFAFSSALFVIFGEYLWNKWMIIPIFAIAVMNSIRRTKDPQKSVQMHKFKTIACLIILVTPVWLTFNLTRSRVLEILDHDNVFHFYLLNHFSQDSQAKLPAEMQYLPSGFHQSIGNVFHLFNSISKFDFIYVYIFIIWLAMFVFSIGIASIFQEESELNINSRKKWVFNKSISIYFTILVGWGLWLLWMGNVVFLFAIGFFCLFLASFEEKKKENRFNGLQKYIYASAAIICWSPILAPVGFVLARDLYLDAGMKGRKFYSNLSSYFFKDPTILILGYSVLLSIYDSRFRLKSESYPIFSSDSVSGIGEIATLPLLLLLCTFVYFKLNIYHRIFTIAIFNLITAAFIDIVLGVWQGNNTSYYSYRYVFISFLMVATFWVNTKNNQLVVIQAVSTKKPMVFITTGLIVVTAVTISFPWGVPEWGRAVKVGISTPNYTVLPGARQYKHVFLDGKAADKLIDGATVLAVSKNWKRCQNIYSKSIFMSSNIKRSGNAMYTAMWISALNLNKEPWEYSQLVFYDYRIDTKHTLETEEQLRKYIPSSNLLINGKLIKIQAKNNPEEAKTKCSIL